VDQRCQAVAGAGQKANGTQGGADLRSVRAESQLRLSGRSPALIHLASDCRAAPFVTNQRTKAKKKSSTPSAGIGERTMRQQFRIPPRLVEKTRAIARREKITTSDVVRRALEAFEGDSALARLELELRNVHKILEELLVRVPPRK
jgi:hypothetical protein